MADWLSMFGPSLSTCYQRINRFRFSWNIKHILFSYPLVSHTTSTVLYNVFGTFIQAIWKTLVCNVLYNTNDNDFSEFHNLSVSLPTSVYIKYTYLYNIFATLHYIVYNNRKTLSFFSSMIVALQIHKYNSNDLYEINKEKNYVYRPAE